MEAIVITEEKLLLPNWALKTTEKKKKNSIGSNFANGYQKNVFSYLNSSAEKIAEFLYLSPIKLKRKIMMKQVCYIFTQCITIK